MVDRSDLDKPSPARMYDYYLGGATNFAVDREAAERALEAMPFTRAGARTNRAWLGRTVRYLAGQGIRQFLDLGSGCPTVGNVHQIAQSAADGCRVVYVDNDPVAVAHGERILDSELGFDRASVAVCFDMREVDEVLRSASGYLDFDQPIAVLASAVLHFVPDEDDPAGLLANYCAPLVPGSYLAISHMSPIGRPTEEMSGFTRAYEKASLPLSLRDHDEVAELLVGYDLVEPGLVRVPLWCPDTPTEPADEEFPGFAALARIHG